MEPTERTEDEARVTQTNRESEAPEARGAQATRRRLLAAAEDVFATRGYHQATVDDIVRAAQSSKGAFYFHFANKEAVFLALVEAFAQSLLLDIFAAVERESGAKRRVEAALYAGVEAFAARPRLSRIFLVEAVGLNPAFEAKRREIYAAFARLIRGYLDQAVADGDLPPLDTELAAYGWLGAIGEVVVRYLDGQDAQALRKRVPELARFALRAVGWSESEIPRGIQEPSSGV
ncbi:MAG TPA: TetR/AcrR family transcriptional regulator [Limnochordia bacterium]